MSTAIGWPAAAGRVSCSETEDLSTASADRWGVESNEHVRLEDYLHHCN